MRLRSLIETRPIGYTSKHFSKAWLVLSLLLALFLPATTHALTTLSEGFVTNDKVVLGSIVSLQDNTTDRVDAATPQNVTGLLGVVISDGNSLLSISNDHTAQIQVATSGVVHVLVSNINGDINRGDQITASPIAGVGMKATTNIKVIGIAQDKLSNSNSSTQPYTDKGGQKHTVQMGEVPVLVNVSYFYKQPEKTIIPSVVQNVANAIAGKPVNTVPILITLAIFIVTMIVVVSIVYSMIRSSIISVGRNPMSQSAIYRGQIQLSGLVLVILTVAFLSMYMILKRL